MSKIEEPWRFRAATMLKEPRIRGLHYLTFGVVLDLGFGIYRVMSAALEGAFVVEGMQDLAIEFAANWCANGEPNPLRVTTIRQSKHLEGLWMVQIDRIELGWNEKEVDQIDPIGYSSLAQALIEQGLCREKAS